MLCLSVYVVLPRQVDYVKLFHYVGAGGAFLSSTLFVCLQSALTYKLARTQGEYRTGHLRVAIALLALVTLVLGILFKSSPKYFITFTMKSKRKESQFNTCNFIFLLIYFY